MKKDVRKSKTNNGLEGSISLDRKTKDKYVGQYSLKGRNH